MQPPAGMPDLPPGFAKKTIANLGVGGHCYIRPPYWPAFHGAARDMNIRISRLQTFRNGVWVLRITRLK